MVPQLANRSNPHLPIRPYCFLWVHKYVCPVELLVKRKRNHAMFSFVVKLIESFFVKSSFYIGRSKVASQRSRHNTCAHSQTPNKYCTHAEIQKNVLGSPSIAVVQQPNSANLEKRTRLKYTYFTFKIEQICVFQCYMFQCFHNGQNSDTC